MILSLLLTLFIMAVFPKTTGFLGQSAFVLLIILIALLYIYIAIYVLFNESFIAGIGMIILAIIVVSYESS